MRLYAGSSVQFIEDTVQNQIAGKLSNSYFKHFRCMPADSEKRSWKNSLRAMALVIRQSNLLDHGIILEYQLPMSSRRLDCLICGRDEEKRDSAVIVELKQWEKCEPADSDVVVTWVGGAHREVLHPSIQVGRYRQYLIDQHTAFYSDGDSALPPVGLDACAYLHNYSLASDDPLIDSTFTGALRECPIFTEDDVDGIIAFLVDRMKMGEGIDVLTRIEESKYRPSKKLMQHVADVIRENKDYVLLDEQLVVYDKVRNLARKGFHTRQKHMIIAKGGPGTGKSVIAMNLLGDLLREGYNAHYATGSRSFTQTLRKIIGSRGSVQFKYFNSYARAEENAVDILIADEAHRIRYSSDSRYTKKTEKSDKRQIDELIDASKVAVFFIDEKQGVRPDEIGSVEYLREAAERSNCELHEYELDIQFRCGGSEAFVKWIDNTLAIERTPNVLWDRAEDFDFRIMSSPQELEHEIRARVAEGYSGRIAAGFCWPWSAPTPEGFLNEDVVIDEYRRPWNAKPDARTATGIPKSHFWAYDPTGIDQIGCIYTAQGFEYDYAGVIIGKDLVYDWEANAWKAQKHESADTAVKKASNFLDLIKNQYRVLLTRGMLGCYVYFVDRATEKYIRTRIES